MLQTQTVDGATLELLKDKREATKPKRELRHFAPKIHFIIL